jgi:RNA polymerase sigma-B factor
MTVVDLPSADGSAYDARPYPRDACPVGELLSRGAALARTDPRRRQLRHRAVAAGVPTALALARRYADRGEPLEDLRQVAIIGLIKAVNSYDPAQGARFWAYATPTIAGELKHHFRDSGWAVRVPRRYKELQHRMNRCSDELAQRLHRLPRPADFAEHLGIGADEILQALRAGNGYGTTPLPAAAGADRGDPGVDRAGGGSGGPERGYELVEARDSIDRALRRLPRRERTVIELRYFGELSQAQIAAAVGLSQVAVSRLITRTLRRLRPYLDDAR